MINIVCATFTPCDPRQEWNCDIKTRRNRPETRLSIFRGQNQSQVGFNLNKNIKGLHGLVRINLSEYKYFWTEESRSNSLYYGTNKKHIRELARTSSASQGFFIPKEIINNFVNRYTTPNPVPQYYGCYLNWEDREVVFNWWNKLTEEEKVQYRDE